MLYTAGVGHPVRPLRCHAVFPAALPHTRVISFDVEEHHRIEAAAGVAVPVGSQRAYGERMERVTLDLLDRLAAANVLATFFVVGDIAETRPRLVRAIHAAGHEIGSHSWDHRRVHHFDPKSFRDDLLRSKDAIEQVTGERVTGFRAPTFSVTRETGWAIDVLAECGFEYDSSIFPVRHDRYGIPDAPRGPFIAQGAEQELLELPPLTYRVAGVNLPVAGGGYFRLFPPAIMRAGLQQAARGEQNVAMLYFHPWEFDPEQPRLPLGRLSRWRTYVGVGKTTDRLERLLQGYSFRRAIDVARDLRTETLPRYRVAEEVKAAGVALA
ncbi:polysaccharide deacetylase family protein [bacterium]|nr:polysaccharide deacetylase family protein [bacterium]